MTNTGCRILHVYFHTHFSLISIVLGHGSLSISLHCTVPIILVAPAKQTKTLKKKTKGDSKFYTFFGVPTFLPPHERLIDIRLKVAKNPRI